MKQRQFRYTIVSSMLSNPEEWKKIIVSLPDEDFFNIMRNYLGELKTPFNKHSLVDKLFAFLSKEETMDRIVELISEADAYLLTLIFSLGEPEINDLYSFVKNTKSFLEFQHLVINLEERLLIFREPDTGRIRLSPIFRKVLLEKVIDTRLIFPFIEADTTGTKPPWMSEALLVAFFSFLKNSPDLFKLDGTLKKRYLDELSTIFPSLFDGQEYGTRFDFLTKTLINLGLIEDNNNNLSINFDSLSSFVSLDIMDRYTLLVSSMVLETGKPKDIFKLASVLSSFLRSIPADKGFSRETLTLLATFFSRKRGIGTETIKKMIDILIYSEILGPIMENVFSLNSFYTQLLENEDQKDPVFVIQSSFMITAKPWLNLKTGLPLAMSANVVKFDLFTQYEINKNSCSNIRAIGLTPSELVTYLNDKSGQRVPQNILTSIKHWEEEYNTIQLYDGYTMVAAESRRLLIDHIEALKPFIKANPAPGVYILSREDKSEWTKILTESGLSSVPQIKSFETKTAPDNPFLEYNYHIDVPEQVSFIEQKTPRVDKDPSFQKELIDTLKKCSYPRNEYEDIAARIDKKLILFPEQVKNAPRVKDKAEVGGLDYTGKIRLIQRAIKGNQTILEIKSAVLPEDNDHRILLKPTAVIHDGPNLNLQAKVLPEGEDLEIPIRKISNVKLLKSSLYAPVTV